MAEIIKAATRDGYGKALVELGAINDKLVVLDADLAEATKTAMFKKAYPDRFFDTGIAECNMIGVAGGLSTIGYTVFASSFAMFAAGRAFEQIRNTIGYPHLNVKIGATPPMMSKQEQLYLLPLSMKDPYIFVSAALQCRDSTIPITISLK